MKSKKDKVMEVLIEVYKPKVRGKIETSFKAAWRGLERVDKIETLISLERDVVAQPVLPSTIGEPTVTNVIPQPLTRI
jgi:hypothetical protein